VASDQKAGFIQADGKILAGAMNGEPFLNRGTLLRYNLSGALDTTFGNNGFVDLMFPGGISTMAVPAEGCVASGLADARSSV
jgi:hypothetical protein